MSTSSRLAPPTPLADPRVETLVMWAQAPDDPLADTEHAALSALADSRPRPEAAPALALAARAAYERIPTRGPRDLQGGHALVDLLAELGEPGARELVRLSERVHYRNAQRKIRSALARLTRELRTPLGELEDAFVGPEVSADLTVPVRVGPFAAELEVSDDLRRVRTSWRGQSGRPVRNRPAKASAYSDELALRKEERGRLQAHLTDLRTRLEQAMLEERAWPYEQWITRMFADPLRAAFARRLIWVIEAGDARILAVPSADGLRDVSGDPVAPDREGTVKLWHPADDPDAQKAWGRRIAELELVQPIDQASREVTCADPDSPALDLADADDVRQTPLRGFLMGRGWHVPYLGPWFTVPEATRELVVGGPKAVLELGYDEATARETIVVRSLTFRSPADRPLDARRLPPRLVSEAARDVLGALAAARTEEEPTS